MTNQEILTKAIEQAIKDGWHAELHHGWVLVNKEPHDETVRWTAGKDSLNIESEYATEEWSYPATAVIFSRDFAKAFWPKDLVCPFCGDSWKGVKGCRLCDGIDPVGRGFFIDNWRWNIQKQVISDDPIAYLERGLKQNPDLLNGGKT